MVDAVPTTTGWVALELAVLYVNVFVPTADALVAQSFVVV
jgi:hypothetical protein